MNSANRAMIRTPRAIILLAMATGLLARAWVIWHAPGHEFAVDQLFDTLAWNLLTLHQFSLDGVNPAAHVGPLYPTVLAGFYALVGHRPEWVPLLHVLFDLGTAWCVYRVGTALWGAWIGSWTACLVFLYPAYWTYDARIRSEELLTLLVSLWLWATVMCRQSPSRRHYAFMGFAAGLTILCKPAALVLALLLMGLIWASTDQLFQKMANVVVYGTTCLILVVPWSVRNYVAFHQAIPVSAGIGVGLWMGSDPVSRGSWPMPLEREQAIWESAGITPLPHAYAMFEVPTDLLLREKGLKRIAADPIGYIGLILTRVWDFWIGNSFYLVNAEGELAQGFQKDVAERGWAVAIYSLLKRFLLIPGFLLFATYSSWVHRKRWRDLLPLYLFPVGLTAGYVPFTVEAGRYALPVLPCLIMLAMALTPYRQTIQSFLGKRPVSPQAMSV